MSVNIRRINYYIPLDIGLISSELLMFKINSLNYKPTPQDLVAYLATTFGEPAWVKPTHSMYKSLISFARLSLKKEQ